jgi:hypothetical protein
MAMPTEAPQMPPQAPQVMSYKSPEQPEEAPPMPPQSRLVVIMSEGDEAKRFPGTVHRVLISERSHGPLTISIQGNHNIVSSMKFDDIRPSAFLNSRICWLLLDLSGRSKSVGRSQCVLYTNNRRHRS